MSELGKACKHGSLARQCQICELESQNESLRKELEAVKTHHRFDLEQFRKCEAKLAVAREALETIIANPKSCCAEAHDLVAQEAFAKLDEAK